MSLHAKKALDVPKTGYLQWHVPLETPWAHFEDMVKLCSVPGQEQLSKRRNICMGMTIPQHQTGHTAEGLWLHYLGDRVVNIDSWHFQGPVGLHLVQVVNSSGCLF